MWRRSKKALDFDAPLSPEADAFLADATGEFNLKQQVLDQDWRFSSYIQWGFDAQHGVLTLNYADGAQLLADGQLLGTFCISDSSFEWAWNNPRFSTAIVRDSRMVRETGVKFDISYLKAGLIPVPDDVYLSYLSAIGIKATGSAGIFRGSGGDVQPLIAVKNLRWA